MARVWSIGMIYEALDKRKVLVLFDYYTNECIGMLDCAFFFAWLGTATDRVVECRM